MKKRLGVLLLRVDGAPDLPAKSYAEQLFTGAGTGTRNLVDYFDEMSHGRLDLSDSQVFDWIDYGHTRQDVNDAMDAARTARKDALIASGLADADAELQAGQHAHGVGRATIQQWAREAAAAHQLNLTGFDVLVCVFNAPMDYFGSPGEVVLNWNAANVTMFSIDLTGVSHEIGHGLGLPTHSRLEGSAEEYGDDWDILSAYAVHEDRSGHPANPYYTFGPGLNAANMDLAGWLDPTRVHTGAGRYDTMLRLRPLHRRDLPGWLAARVQLGWETIFVEFRAQDRWDAALPAPCILLHRQTTHPENGRPCSELIHGGQGSRSRPDLRVGESYVVGNASDPFGFYAEIAVVDIDAANNEAQLRVVVRERRHIDPSATIYGAVNTDGGGLVWTPGRGFVRVPPRSPLLNVLELISQVSALQAISGDPRTDGIVEEGLTSARDQLSTLLRLRKQPLTPTGRQLQRQQSGSTSTSAAAAPPSRIRHQVETSRGE